MESVEIFTVSLAQKVAAIEWHNEGSQDADSRDNTSPAVIFLGKYEAPQHQKCEQDGRDSDEDDVEASEGHVVAELGV